MRQQKQDGSIPNTSLCRQVISRDQALHLGDADVAWQCRKPPLRDHVATAARKAPSTAGKGVSPHVLRHTCAMHTLQATRDVRKVSLWLGHASLQSTEVYLRADPTEKLEALAAMAPPMLKLGRFRAPDKLLAMLSTAGRKPNYAE